MDQPALSQALRLLRGELRLKQCQVADRAGITKAMLSSYETGAAMPSFQTLSAILGSLECTFHDLQDALDRVHGRTPQRTLSEAPAPVLDAAELTNLSSLLKALSECLASFASRAADDTGEASKLSRSPRPRQTK